MAILEVLETYYSRYCESEELDDQLS